MGSNTTWDNILFNPQIVVLKVFFVSVSHMYFVRRRNSRKFRCHFYVMKITELNVSIAGIIENLTEFRPELCSEVAKQGFLQWILKRLKVFSLDVSYFKLHIILCINESLCFS